jgi:hypothetical protein
MEITLVRLNSVLILDLLIAITELELAAFAQ